MTFEVVQKWVTSIGVVIAAGVSILNFRYSLSAKSDKIKVGFGPIRPPLAPGDWLYVVSRRDHSMTLRDYGFIDNEGGLHSLPDMYANEPGMHDEVVHGGSTVFSKMGDQYEEGYINVDYDAIGAYAVTAAQEHYTLGFGSAVPWWQRARIALQVRWSN